MKKYIFLGASAFAFVTSQAQVDRSIVPTAGKAPVINIKESEVFTLDNGITVILSENHKIPEVSFNLVMGSDPVVEGSKVGVSELMGQLLTSGTAKRTKDVMDNEIDFIGASLSASGSNVFMTCLTKHISKGTDLMADAAMNSIFPESEFTRIVTQAESGLMNIKSSPEEMASNAVKKSIFGASHSRGEMMTEMSIKNITRNDVLEYYKVFFTPKGAYLVVVGDITRAELEKIAKDKFGSWKGGDKITFENPKPKPITGTNVVFVNQPGAVQSNISLAFPLDLKQGDKDILAFNVLEQIFGGGGFSTRLMKNVREDKGYTYGAYGRGSISPYGSYFSTSGAFRNEVSDSAITEMLKELNIITNETVTDAELKSVLATMAGSFGRSLESPQTVANFALNTIRYNLPKDYYQTYLTRLAAVTKDDVLDAAQKFFNAKRCNVIVVGNSDILPQLAKLDSDGKIEKVDEFGDAKKEIMASDLTKEQFIAKYADVMVAGKNAKAKAKTLKKIKNYVVIMEGSVQGTVLAMTRAYIAPSKEVSTMSVPSMGMVVQSSAFDGKKGYQSNMQEGKKDLTAEEIAQQQKSMGLVPEMNYLIAGMAYEMVGIEEVNGKKFYVLKTNDGSGDTFSYYDVTTMMKMKSVSSPKGPDGTVTTVTTTFDDYKQINGLYFAHKTVINAGEQVLPMTAKSITVNGKLDSKLTDLLKM
jgi:zinc protease